MESTLLHSFLRAAKLKRWFSDSLCPPVIREIKLLFDHIYASKTSDDDHFTPTDELNDVDQCESSFMASSAPANLRPLLTKLTHKVHLQARFKHHGILYATSKTHQGNSQIYFYPNGDTSVNPIPGCIKFIFREGSNNSLALGIQQLLPFNGGNDPFAIYPHFPAQLYSTCLSNKLEKIHPDWILCHFAMWHQTADQAVVLSLSCVCSICLVFNWNADLYFFRTDLTWPHDHFLYCNIQMISMYSFFIFLFQVTIFILTVRGLL